MTMNVHSRSFVNDYECLRMIINVHERSRTFMDVHTSEGSRTFIWTFMNLHVGNFWMTRIVQASHFSPKQCKHFFNRFLVFSRSTFPSWDLHTGSCHIAFFITLGLNNYLKVIILERNGPWEFYHLSKLTNCGNFVIFFVLAFGPGHPSFSQAF